MAEELAKLGEELEDLWTSMRLFERKLLVVQDMMLEAEAESQRCERDIEMCNEELIADDEMGDLRDDERVDIFNEIRALEVEFAHWCRLYAIRAQEKHDTKRNLQRLSVARRELLTRACFARGRAAVPTLTWLAWVPARRPVWAG